ncbi:MAG: cobalamin B12-binding domain-containing protein [Nitrospinae bacterium]|nr:cobalamin B12-binding domain-containing protein [Nitrospinota bacterium]
MNSINDLSLLVERGENNKAVALADRMLDTGVDIHEIIKALTSGLGALRNKCTVENFQLLDVLLASRAVTEVIDQCIARRLQNTMDEIADAYEILHSSNGRRQKALVIGTIQGDVHDLGKHIVATISRLSDIKVINLGKDVPPQNFIDAAIRERADIIGVSSLMTVCLSAVKEVKPLCIKNGLANLKVVAGGSAAQQASAESLGVDYVSFDAFDGLNYFKSL